MDQWWFWLWLFLLNILLFNFIVFILSLCLHVLSMYVWLCPHHGNPSLPAEGKLRCYDNTVAPLFPLLSFSLALTSSLFKGTKEIKDVCVCVRSSLCLLHGDLRHFGWGEKNTISVDVIQKKRDKRFFYTCIIYINAMLRRCCVCVAVLLDAGWSGSMATVRAQEIELMPHSPHLNLSVLCNMADVCSLKKGRSSYMIFMS